jgi:UDP-glucose 4-epimerase
VVIFDNESNGHNHNKEAKELKGDITIVDDLDHLNSLGVDYIVHLAAAISVAESMKDPEKYTKNNVEGSRKVRYIKQYTKSNSERSRQVPFPSALLSSYLIPKPQTLPSVLLSS